MIRALLVGAVAAAATLLGVGPASAAGGLNCDASPSPSSALHAYDASATWTVSCAGIPTGAVMEIDATVGQYDTGQPYAWIVLSCGYDGYASPFGVSSFTVTAPGDGTEQQVAGAPSCAVSSRNFADPVADGWPSLGTVGYWDAGWNPHGTSSTAPDSLAGVVTMTGSPPSDGGSGGGGSTSTGCTSVNVLNCADDSAWTAVGSGLHHPIMWGVFPLAAVCLCIGLVIRWARKAAHA